MKRQQTALDAYVRHYGFILENIEKLNQLADAYFGHNPDSINWSHVDDLRQLDSALNNLLALFSGEMREKKATPKR